MTNNNNSKRICSRCISDTSIPGIRFDERGICNYCKIHDNLEDQFPLDDLGQQKLNQLVKEIKRKGENKRYNCIVGLSGGTDSTYCLYISKKLGLKPLAVHFDNGWDTEIAKKNMKNAVTKLDVELKTVTCDWDEYKELQISFLKASVPDAEMPTDIAIISALYRAAAEAGIHYVINGHSFRAEGIMPLRWSYGDGRYIKSVHRKFGVTKLKNFPNLSIANLLHYVFVKRVHIVPLLAYIDYNKEDAKRVLEQELDWTYYGGHHFESEYTTFIIYLRGKKFGIDTRKIEYSALVRSGQKRREEALALIEAPFIEDTELVRACITKLGLSNAEFEAILAAEPKTFIDYPTYYTIIRALRVPIKLACRVNLLPAIFYEKYLGQGD